MDDLFRKEFIDQSLKTIHENTTKIDACMQVLNEQEIWFRHNEHVNSVGNIILHLCGNIRQYIISSIGGARDIRERDLEFSTTGGISKPELTSRWHEIIRDAKTIISDASYENLLRHRIVQGMEYSGIGIIVHVTEHYSYHTGQIIFLTKLYKNMDMGFYKGAELSERNA